MSEGCDRKVYVKHCQGGRGRDMCVGDDKDHLVHRIAAARDPGGPIPMAATRNRDTRRLCRECRGEGTGVC